MSFTVYATLILSPFSQRIVLFTASATVLVVGFAEEKLRETSSSSIAGEETSFWHAANENVVAAITKGINIFFMMR